MNALGKKLFVASCVAHGRNKELAERDWEDWCEGLMTQEQWQQAAEIFLAEHQASIQARVANAVHDAVGAVYFDDGSDFARALNAVVAHLAPDLAELLGKDPSAAWHAAKARKDAALLEAPPEQSMQPLPPQLPPLAWISNDGRNEIYHAHDFTPDANDIAAWRPLVAGDLVAEDQRQPTKAWLLIGGTDIFLASEFSPPNEHEDSWRSLVFGDIPLPTATATQQQIPQPPKGYRLIKVEPTPDPVSFHEPLDAKPLPENAARLLIESWIKQTYGEGYSYWLQKESDSSSWAWWINSLPDNCEAEFDGGTCWIAWDGRISDYTYLPEKSAPKPIHRP